MTGIDKLKKFVEDNRSLRAMITFHSIGDSDSVASAIGMKKILKNAEIREPDFTTSNARLLLDNWSNGEAEIKKGFMEEAELVVLVDVNNFEDCGSFKENLGRTKAKILIIDHHAPSSVIANAEVFNDESYNSSSSIVYELCKAMGTDVDAHLAEVLAMGIISDSAEFKNATAQSFVQIGELLSIAGTNYQVLLEKYSHIAPAEVREHTIKDIMGAEIGSINGLIFVKGTTSTHAAIAADDAIKIGADIALFSSESEDEISFSARCRPPLDIEIGLHLGRVMKDISYNIEGSGGGHPCAAGAYGKRKEGKQNFIAEFEKRVFYGRSDKK